MRLSCSNCEAEYEVPDDAIPPGGRDVQCSNCSHTWFVDRPGTFDVETAPRPPVPAPAAPVEIEDEDDSFEPAEDFAAEKPQVSSEARNILREETLRERAARQADFEPEFEVQEDLGLQSPPQSKEPSMADVRAAAAGEHEEPPLSRRGQLPNIEEINSSLSATTVGRVKERKPKAEPKVQRARPARGKAGFRIGFGLSLVVMATLAALYILAPNITEFAPQYADQVNTYVFWINDARQTVFEWADILIARLQAPAT